MKKLLFAFLFLTIATVASALPAYRAVQYTLFVYSPTGTATPVIYNAGNTSSDSLWAYIQANGTVAGSPVYTAIYYGSTASKYLPYGPSGAAPPISSPYTSRNTPSQYVLAYQINSATVTSAGVQVASGITSPVPIANGGTAQTTRQAAIDGLSNSATGTTGWVLTDSSSHAVWQVAAGGSSKCLIAGQSSRWSNAFNPGFLPLNASFAQSTTTAATDFSGATSAPWVASIAGTLKNWYLAEDVAPTGGHDTIQVWKNGAVTTLKIVIANTATTGSDATHTVSVAAGDKFYIGGTAGSTDNGTAATWGFEFDPN